MGHDVMVISNHRIDTATTEKMAEWLAMAWGVNIVLGYQHDDDSDGNWKNTDFKFTKVFTVDNNMPRTIGLLDMLYDERISHPRMYPPEAMRYEIFDWAAGTDDCVEGCMVNGYTFESNVHYYGRWWNFLRFFGADNTDGYQYLNEFRKKVYEEIRPIGGTAALYYDDQGVGMGLVYGNDDMVSLTWDALMEKVKAGVGENLIHIPEWLKQPDKQFLEVEDRYVFYDDFSDFIK